MVQFRLKYDSKFKQKKRSWKTVDIETTCIHTTDWYIFEFKIDGIIYTNPSKEFQEAYDKILMWEEICKTR